MEKVIIDGDWGGDEMQLAAVLLAHPDRVQVLGATAVFGNTTLKQVVENARNILHLLKSDHVKVYAGAKGPGDSAALEGDLAHGADGIGNVGLEKSPLPYETTHAVDFILRQLRENAPGTVTITVSGPQTNIAEAIRKDPETMKRVKQVVILGGCTEDMPAHDRPTRRGNITHHAEFNVQQAAADAQVVMQSGLPIALVPMNTSHALTVTPALEKRLSQAYRAKPKIKDALLGMMKAPAALDRMKFNSDPVMHDINCALFLLHPDNYQTEKGNVSVTPRDDIAGPESRTGRTEFSPSATGTITVATRIIDPARFHDVFMDSITALIPPQQKLGMAVGG